MHALKCVLPENADLFHISTYEFVKEGLISLASMFENKVPLVIYQKVALLFKEDPYFNKYISIGRRLQIIADVMETIAFHNKKVQAAWYTPTTDALNEA
jgi:hypothetical protein